MSAKDLKIKPISAKDANALTKRLHYSGKVVQNSSLHFGVFYNDRLEGVMQYGSSINKKGTMNLVSGTGWNEFIELNRMAFSEALPKNSESRAIAVTIRLIKKHYPHIKWIISFADGTQCGDGAIYRASGFILTNIAKNTSLRINPETGVPMHIIQAHHLKIQGKFRTWQPIPGYQFRYLYFIDKTYEDKLTVPKIPFSKITELGIGMYKGEYISRGLMEEQQIPSVEGGSIPTSTLQIRKAS